MKHVKLTPISLKSCKDVNENWIHDCIAEDPTILGLGDVVVKDRERIQVGSGRLDMLLQDGDDGNGRYEVEIQLGATDPSHIIRTIEYWDIERKRFPAYEHTAVIVAEDITSRFLNVIGLLNGTIPIIAIQMTAVRMPDGISLIFTKVLDTLQLGLSGEDEGLSEPADRDYWLKRGSAKTVKLADRMVEICRSFAPDVELNYNKPYIGLKVNGKANNFAYFYPRKTFLNTSIKLPRNEDIDTQLEEKGFTLLDYGKRAKAYRIKLSAQDVEKHADYLATLLKQAFDLRSSE